MRRLLQALIHIITATKTREARLVTKSDNGNNKMFEHTTQLSQLEENKFQFKYFCFVYKNKVS